MRRAQSLRRLRRICRHYGSEPVFCLASATISNPGEHARRLIEAPVTVIDEDSSAAGPRHYMFLSPDLVSEMSGMRVPAIEAARLRLRPILMTSLSFILGAMPLVLASGAGANARHSIGTGIIGGMIAATTLALFFVPLFYYLIVSITSRRRALTPGKDA